MTARQATCCLHSAETTPPRFTGSSPSSFSPLTTTTMESRASPFPTHFHRGWPRASEQLPGTAFQAPALQNTCSFEPNPQKHL